MNNVIERISITILGLMLAFCFFGMYKSVTTTNQAQVACDKKDGHLIRAKSGLVCLDKRIVL